MARPGVVESWRQHLAILAVGAGFHVAVTIALVVFAFVLWPAPVLEPCDVGRMGGGAFQIPGNPCSEGLRANGTKGVLVGYLSVWTIGAGAEGREGRRRVRRVHTATVLAWVALVGASYIALRLGLALLHLIAPYAR